MRRQLLILFFLISQCYNVIRIAYSFSHAVAPFLISQCYNSAPVLVVEGEVVAPFLISQCYNRWLRWLAAE